MDKLLFLVSRFCKRYFTIKAEMTWIWVFTFIHVPITFDSVDQNCWNYAQSMRNSISFQNMYLKSYLPTESTQMFLISMGDGGISQNYGHTTHYTPCKFFFMLLLTWSHCRWGKQFVLIWGCKRKNWKTRHSQPPRMDRTLDPACTCKSRLTSCPRSLHRFLPIIFAYVDQQNQKV